MKQPLPILLAASLALAAVAAPPEKGTDSPTQGTDSPVLTQGTDSPAQGTDSPVLTQGTDSTVSFRAGGDVRLRQEGFDHVMIKSAEPAVTRGGHNDYFRFRTRVNVGADVGEAASLDARLANEVRARNIGQRSYEWPDELIVDQLKLTLRGLLDGRADATIGRQDLFLGSGRLFAEGTAKDGSRTQYFDGALVRVRLAEKTTLDVFGLYGSCENDLAIGHEHRDVTGYAGGFTGMDEASAGFFLDDRSADALGWGLYYIWKHDTAWHRPDGAAEPHEDIHTVGARLLPRLTEAFSAEVEGAFQWSDSDGCDRRAGFAFGGLKYAFRPGTYVSANALTLTGDDPDTARREDFNVLYGRYPWISELLIYGFDGDGVGTWNNLTQLWLEAGHAFGEKGAHKVKATVGPVFAPERNGAGGGDERGWLETVFYSFPVAKGRFGDLTGHLFLEVFEPGDYYVSDRTAYFFRWQLNWAF